MAKYYVTRPGSPEKQVSKLEYVRAERANGFYNTLGKPDEPATASWSKTLYRRNYDGKRVPETTSGRYKTTGIEELQELLNLE